MTIQQTANLTTSPELRDDLPARDVAAVAPPAVCDSEQYRTWIAPEKGWPTPDLGELWRYRDLLILLTLRSIAARYRQSVLGVGWAIARPLMSMLIFTIIFGRVAGLSASTGKVPYPLFAFVGLISWMYFAECLANSTSSVVANRSMVTRTYFPRLILPLTTVAASGVDLAIQLFMLLPLMAFYRVAPSLEIILVPVFVLLGAITALSLSLWLTALNVMYRDVGHTIPFLTQAWMYLTPVIYPVTLIPDRWQAVYYLNPMTGVVVGLRWALLGDTPPPWSMILVSAAASAALLAGGLFYFRKTESFFADII
jgi:lipopolysaccharide transport system permease protein